MKPLNQLKSFIFYKTLNTEIKRKKRTVKAINPDECQYFLILFDTDDEAATQAISNYSQTLKQDGKIVVLTGFTRRPDAQTEGKNFMVVTKEDVNWYGKPVLNEKTAQITNREWDCVLSLHTTPIPALDYFAATTSAATKAGFYHNNLTWLDILVDAGKGDFRKSLGYLLNILKTIKSRSYEPVI